MRGCLERLTYVAILLGDRVPQNLLKCGTLQWIDLRGTRDEGRMDV